MKNELLRHTLATIKYRFDLSVDQGDDSFGDFSLGQGSRSSTEIVYHMHHVLYSTRVYLEKEQVPTEKPNALTFRKEIERFSNELVNIDLALELNELPLNYAKRLLQGPLSDILTHIGQIALLQRLNGKPIPGEDFSAASIRTGMQ